jgi:ubiquinone/menaquinone biosynthesis C-methylase UbiE
VTSEPAFRDDLYRGTAADYDRFRLPYPRVLIDSLCERIGLSGEDRLLDLACGPGTVTFAVCDRFAEVWAVDLEPGAIAFAADRAETLGVRNVRWMAGRAEDVDPDERFDVVTIGTAFHRLDRPRVAALSAGWLRSGGHLALLWSSTPLHGPAPWQQAMAEIVAEWMDELGARDRLPPQLERHIAEHPHVRVLEDAGFEVVDHHEVRAMHGWTVETLVGFVYSTSLLSRVVVGSRAAELEDVVRERLCALEPSGAFREDVSFAYDLARRPDDR